MVIISDGNSENYPHASRRKISKNQVCESVDLNKGLEQIKLSILLYTRASISDLPSSLNTMLLTGKLNIEKI